MTRQNNLRRYVPVASVLLFAVFAVLLLGGCSPMANGPASFSDSEKTLEWLNDNSNANGATNSQSLNAQPVGYDTTVSFTCGTQGGNYQLTVRNDVLKFQLSGGSLSKTVLITVHVTKTVTDLGPFWQLDCGPSGLVFAKPLTVKISSPDLKKDTITLYYFDPLKLQWVVQQVAGKLDPLNIYHFSKYGISTR